MIVFDIQKGTGVIITAESFCDLRRVFSSNPEGDKGSTVGEYRR